MTLFDIRVTTTVNWLGAPRCLRQMKWCSEQEETTSVASAPSEQCDYVSDRKGRWFESNRGSQIKALSVLLSAFYFLYCSKSKIVCFFEK